MRVKSVNEINNKLNKIIIKHNERKDWNSVFTKDKVDRLKVYGKLIRLEIDILNNFYIDLKKENNKDELDIMYEQIEILIKDIEFNLEIKCKKPINELFVPTEINKKYLGENLKKTLTLIEKRDLLLKQMKKKNKSRELII